MEIRLLYFSWRVTQIDLHVHAMEDVEIIANMPEIKDNRISQIFSQWFQLVVEDEVPRRTEIDPLKIKSAHPVIWIYELCANQRFRCRLAGEEVRQLFERTVIGEYLDELVNEPGYTALHQQYSKVLDLPGIGYSIGSVFLKGIGRHGVGERIILPLREGDSQPNLVIGATTYTFDLSDGSKHNEVIRRTVCPLRIPFNNMTS